jgi:hypothetical protein
VPDLIAEALLGHVPEGIKGRCMIKWARSEGPKIIEAQRKISRTMMQLLKAKAAAKRKPAA